MLTPGIVENEEWRWVVISGTVLLVLLLVPFVWAYGVGAPDGYFMGVLVNPLDGASYQAKMYQGLTGSWLFELPFTPEAHRGVFVFTFYLALGHLARALNLPPIMVFHAARLIGSMLMVLAFYQLIADFTADVAQRRLTWLLGVLGAGLGWVALAFGAVTPDLLILPEAFPLQAAYANAHFPWALTAALVLARTLVHQLADEDGGLPAPGTELLVLVASSLILILVSPFMLVPIGLGYGLGLLSLWVRHRALPRQQLAWGLLVIVVILPVMAYNLWAFGPDNPVFQAWMAQNRTPSPPVWGYLAAFGPLLVLAAVGAWASRRRLHVGDILLLGWLVTSLLLLYAPVGLQRRFAMGVLFPMAVYAGRGLYRVILPGVRPRLRLLVTVLVFATFLPTTVLAIVTPMVGSLQLKNEGGGYYFVDNAELDGIEWLEARQPGSLVLASPETGLFLPTRGLRVVYGHPFETVNPEAREAAVTAFYTGEDCSVASREGVDYIWVGPRERALGEGGGCPLPGDPVYESAGGQVAIYAVDGG